MTVPGTAGEAGSRPGVASTTGTAGSMEEIADDLQHLRRQVRDLATELNALRGELLGDRVALASRSVFEAVYSALDQIILVEASLLEAAPGPGADRDGSGGTASDQDRAARHVAAVGSALRSLLRGLGYTPFTVDVGERFDPARMECLDYADGERGVVLALLRPGYLVGDVVVRPCGVAVADPAPAQRPLDTEARES